jgi:hypothetical protein
VYATDGPRRMRRSSAYAFAVAFGLAGCILNPKTDDPNVESAAQEPRSGGGVTSGFGGSGNTSYGGLPGQVPPPTPGAGGANYGNSDASIGAGGTGPVVSPGADAGAARDGGPSDAVDASDAGDARPDRHPAPTRD